MWEIESSIAEKDIPFQLPINWNWFHWGDLILEYEQGLIRSNSQLGSGNAFYLKMGDLDNNGGCSLAGLAKTQATPHEIATYRLHEGDFLINVRNSMDLVGKTCVIGGLGEEAVLFNHMLVRIRHRDSIPGSFINAFLNIPSSRKLIDRCKQGTTTVIALYKRDLLRIPIPLPDRTTLDHISGFYDAISSKIELNQRLNEEMEGMAKLLYDYWFVQHDFPMSAAQAAALGKPKLQGHPYRTSGGPMTYHETLKREIPVGWGVGSLNSLGEIMGGSTPSTKEPEHFTAQGTPWITPKDMSRNTGNKFISRGETDISEEGIKNACLTLMPAGTVLMSSRAPIGYTAIARNPVTTNQGFKSFVPSKGYSTEFIYYTLNHLMKVIEQNASGSTFKEVSAATLKSISTTLPDSAVRLEFAKVLKPILSQQDTLEQQTQELTALRDWLLPMLMNGQVTVG